MRILGPPEYLVFSRELKCNFLYTLTCKQCSTWLVEIDALQLIDFSCEFSYVRHPN